MKTTIKIVACILCIGFASKSIAQESSASKQKQTKTTKTQDQKKVKKADNKIAVSDQAQPDDKSKKKTAKKDKGISNK